MYSDRDYYRPGGLGGFSFFPPVIKNLLIINIAVYVVYNIILSNIALGDPGAYGTPVSLIIRHYFALQSLGEGFYIWQLVSYQFMHADFMHIFLNMFTLWMFGMEVENQWGSRKFLIYYLVCGIGGGILQLIFNAIAVPGVPVVTVGASGAIFGVMVAFAMMFPNRYIFFYFIIPIKAKYLIGFMFVLQFLSSGEMDMVARFAHIGGAVVGFLFILLDSRNNYSISNFINSFKKSGSSSRSSAQFRKRPSFRSGTVEDAEFYEISKNEEPRVTQEEIDRILDKISQSGYQNLTEKEKKILFEASKRS